ncbi:acyloxyacyl hydrolase [Flavobacterium sp. NG2]|uniref:acyloxyacyl hydrolase n=1 Tax=Flavobacterium sp. NG2 TaxID=3097547 RepID=UPI002A82FA51|nr:acyloxyacyl hydrolase [Flavobacterium sp. NG2]WPR70219.1 acyloxyacyl hydrolase [Flavobacterium sp. NG2]
MEIKSLHKILCLFFVFVWCAVYSQAENHTIFIGLKSGFGNEFENSNYTFTNEYYKLEWNYQLKKSSVFTYELVVQPEINFGTHQLLNFYFVQPEEYNYLERREKYTKMKDINQYIVNIGGIVRTAIYRGLSVYVQASVGPMISDTETERLSKGFAFSDVFGFGISIEKYNLRLDLGANVRHVSNAGLQSSNAGFNTKNIELGLLYKL